jgi:hypothetical protein
MFIGSSVHWSCLIGSDGADEFGRNLELMAAMPAFTNELMNK